MFAKNNTNYSNNENTITTVLAYSHNRHSQYDNKFENSDYSSNNMSVDGSSYVDVEQKTFGNCKHRKHDGVENFDSFMETDNENNPIRMT